LVANGEKYGFVFAISKEKAAWARLGLPGSTIRSHVLRLRTEIDNVGASIVEKSVPFERALAFDLYNAILGAPEIRQVIDEKEDLIFVPSGELTFLPPALFVSSPPDGGSAKDADPNALRATAWLLRSKTITVLPSVSSLRTLRQLFLKNQMSASQPLLALANPQFSEARQPVQTVEATPRPRSLRAFNDYYHDGQPLAALLHQLPDIPGTAEEARQLQSILGAPLDSVLTGDDASKAALTARNLDGRLAKGSSTRYCYTWVLRWRNCGFGTTCDYSRLRPGGAGSAIYRVGRRFAQTECRLGNLIGVQHSKPRCV
jgi:hypothetical protein